MLACAAVLGACADAPVNASTGPVSAGALDDASGSLTVRADSSLRESFELLADQVERRHPKVTVRLEYTSAGDPRAAGADVVVSSNRTRLDALQRAGSVEQATPFAQEVIALVVAPRNPGHVSTARDLRRSGVSVAVCESSQPCGEAAHAVLEQVKVDLSSPTQVSDTQAALGQLTSGKVDAAFVWANDVRGRSGQSARGRGVEPVQLSADPEEDIRLAAQGSRDVLVAVAPSGNRAAAEAFVAQLRSPEGQRTLRADGYR